MFWYKLSSQWTMRPSVPSTQDGTRDSFTFTYEQRVVLAMIKLNTYRYYIQRDFPIRNQEKLSHVYAERRYKLWSVSKKVYQVLQKLSYNWKVFQLIKIFVHFSTDRRSTKVLWKVANGTHTEPLQASLHYRHCFIIIFSIQPWVLQEQSAIEL